MNRATAPIRRRNVRENADVFVMIVGARYGSIDPDTEKSVTNLEFLEAQARGIPTYVFVDSDVLAHLSVGRSNPDADYSGVVDTPRVFEFIDSFRGSGYVWTFPFATAKDIVDTLGKQFANLVQDAFALRQMAHGHDHLLKEFAGDALMVPLRRGELWVTIAAHRATVGAGCQGQPAVSLSTDALPLTAAYGPGGGTGCGTRTGIAGRALSPCREEVT